MLPLKKIEDAGCLLVFLELSFVFGLQCVTGLWQIVWIMPRAALS